MPTTPLPLRVAVTRSYPGCAMGALAAMRRLTAATAAVTLASAGLALAAPSASAAPHIPTTVAATTAPAAPAENQSQRLILDEGHTDIWHVTAENGGLQLDLREDITGQHVRHAPDEVELHVKSAAKASIPEGWPAAGEAYHLPMTQRADLLWPGWDTQSLAGSDVDPAVRLEITDVAGPGEIHLFSQSAFGNLVPVLADGSTQLSPGAVREQSFPAHTHAHWAFTEPGVYQVTVRATGTKDGAEIASEPQVYTFTVGDEFRGQADASAEEPAPEQPAPEEPAPEQPAPKEPAPEEPAPEQPAPEKPAPQQPAPPKPPADDPAPAPSEQEQRVILEQGHTDIWHVVPRGDDLVLDLREDITSQHVTHDPESVELHVKDDAYTEVPEGWPGAGAGYLLPLTEDPQLLWPGWDTQDITGSGFDNAVRLNITDVQGPGEVHLFSQDAFGAMQPLLDNGATRLTAGAVRNQSFPAHTHANWVFTKPGVYHLTVTAQGTKDGKTVTSEPQVYTFTVGKAFRGKADVADPGKINPGKPPVIDKDSGSTPPSGGSTTGGGQQNSAGGAADADKNATPGGSAENGGTPVTSGAPLSGSGSSGGSGGAGMCIATEEVRDATEEEVAAAKGAGESSTAQSHSGDAPAASPGSGSGALQASGAYTVPKNTHSHPNWVFSQPGSYQLTIRQTATLNSGEKVSGQATLNFEVGPNAKGASSGHFDVGSRIEGGKLVPSVKDDRTSPAKWVDPGSVTFALGEAAKATAPAGLEFIAPEGSAVYMVPGTQIPGAPWVGANTMHDSVLAETTGEVTWELVGASGPGNVGVFTSGNFGTLVGEKWFTATASGAPAADSASGDSADSAGGTAAALPVAKDAESAKAGQVFADGDAFKVKEIVGRTASGESCELSASQRDALARTGVDALPLALGAAASALVGGSLLLWRRRRS